MVCLLEIHSHIVRSNPDCVYTSVSALPSDQRVFGPSTTYMESKVSTTLPSLCLYYCSPVDKPLLLHHPSSPSSQLVPLRLQTIIESPPSLLSKRTTSTSRWAGCDPLSSHASISSTLYFQIASFPMIHTSPKSVTPRPAGCSPLASHESIISALYFEPLSPPLLV